MLAHHSSRHANAARLGSRGGAAETTNQDTNDLIQAGNSRQAIWQVLAERQENLKDKIDRAFWCLNLHLLDGFDRDELEALKREASEFSAACASWRQKEAKAA